MQRLTNAAARRLIRRIEKRRTGLVPHELRIKILSDQKLEGAEETRLLLLAEQVGA